MVLFPDVQMAARRHIDKVCKGRLPDFSDYSTLVYVHAVVKEVLRWNQITPLSKYSAVIYTSANELM